ncbi:site-specific DNA-methyltransferase [Tissierella praeacuta]|uniref:site-specific DNA-methyltransferase n=1 Tax=Tissierella praeacuta TaxID=43131 RepID=UPI0028972E0E|nr:site-specific DNA-methyltransferase [Tissierella praeacuta]
MDKLNMRSKDMTKDNIEKIEILFPNVITEIKDNNGNITKAIDFQLLQQELSCEIVEGDKERYQLTWPGKKEAILMGNTPIDKTLRPVKEDSVEWDSTENLYIEGDNLEVLKLLQESYLNKIKCIYIDPPYNTGNDFIYVDDFTQDIDEYLDESGQKDEEGNRLFKNTDANGRYHSDWLTMMYPRLKLARNLLSEDGVIFISIDENEVHNLRKICDEVFGEGNFLTQMVVKLRHERRILKGDKDFHEVCEYCLIYRKSSEYIQSKIMEDNTSIDKYVYEIKLKSSPDEIVELDGKKVEVYSPDNYEVIKHTSPSEDYVQWISVRGSLKDGNSSGRFYMKHLDGIEGKYAYLYKVPNMGNDKLNYRFFMRQPSEKHMNGVYFQGVPVNRSDVKFIPYPNFLDYVDVFNNVGYEGGVVFRNGKKPVRYIIHLLTLGGIDLDKDSIILDFFSGSATTAHAVMQLNAEDGGNRKYIMVQLPEETDEKSEAYKAGYKTIAEIGKERIRRSAKKIKEETNADIDYGFRVFKVDSSNMKDIYYLPNELTQMKLHELEANIKEDRTGLDLLSQVILEAGLPLSLPMETKIISGKEVYFVDENALIACFEKNIDESLIREIAKMKPLKAVFRDNSFKDCPSRINLEEIFKSMSPTTEIKVL